MNILIIGSGGREHALSWKISQSPLCDQLYIAPGNGGTSQHGQNLAISVSDQTGILNAILDYKIDMVVVGPEVPLVEGLKEYLELQMDKIPVFVGPGKSGAILEGSKAYSKEFMKKYKVPTAAYGTFNADSIDAAYGFLDSLNPPYVLKADGLAAGKGVLILDDIQEAKNELKDMFSGKFGDASSTVVIEEFLDGIEFSVFVLTDGTSYVVLPEAKDYKRIGEGDTGLNTGGMGAVSPVSFVTRELMQQVTDRIIEPTMNGIRSEKMDYRGFIFIGLINVGGTVKVIEYNCRLGDPETEVVIPRIKNDLVPLLYSLGDQSLANHTIETIDEHAATIMLVSGGYPGSYEKGKEISNSENLKDTLVFHAGTRLKDHTLKTDGGRVIALTSIKKHFSDAVEQSLSAAQQITFDGKYYRKDIGKDLL